MLTTIAASAGVLFVTAGLIQGATQGTPLWLGLLVAGIFAVDAARSMEFTFLNAERRHKPMALWSAGEAWGRLLAAVTLVVWWGGTVSSVLLGYFAASSLMLWTWYGFAREDTVVPGRHPGVSLAADFTQSLRTYAVPLVPLAVIAWISSSLDRYVIGGLWGLKQAGLYAAAYGLVARPFLMLSSITELVVRPVYYGAVADEDTARSERILRAWLLLVIGFGGAAFMMFWLFKDVIAVWLLAEPYRQGAALLPWIAGGYWLLILSHVFERACYAHRATRAVLLIYSAGGIAALVVLYPAVSHFGITGAAAAVPVYFGAQLLTAVSLEWWSRRKVRTIATRPIRAIPENAT
jgi:O-antigen/teichoic acid export membrane protein